jgi:hypothetical protein
MAGLPLRAKWFAEQFRLLAQKFEHREAATEHGAALEEFKLWTVGGQLFIDVVKQGFLKALSGALQLVEQYESPPPPDGSSSRIMPQVLMELMRHESIDTTMRFYVGRNAQTTAAVLWQAHRQAGETLARIHQHQNCESEPIKSSCS